MNYPANWNIKKIDELYDVVGGGTPSTSIESFWNGNVPWISSADIFGLKDIRPRKRITNDAISNSATNLVPANTIIVVTRVGLGKVSLTKYPLCFSQDSQGLIPKVTDIYQDFILYYLSVATQQFKHVGRGTTIAGVTKNQLKDLHVPLPPLDEQERIVERIESLFSQLDAGVAALKRAQAGLKRYKAAVLKAACEGRLVPQDPADEPAEEMLKRIHPGWAGQSLPAGQPELPRGWCWARVEQLANVVRGGSPRPAGDPKYFGGQIPWITVGNLTADETPYLNSVSTFVTEEGKKKSRYIEPGTLLLTNSGATLGVPKITLIGGCINDGVAALLDINITLQKYLYYFLSSKTKTLRRINQGAAQPNLNTGIIKSHLVPLHPDKEQERISIELDHRLSIIQDMEVNIFSSLSRAARLRQSILKLAFEGRLVEQAGEVEEKIAKISSAAGWKQEKLELE